MRPILSLVLIFTLVLRNAVCGAEWKAGVAKVQITPGKPLWMTGFAARTNVSQGTLQQLYAKALALEDASGRRAVLVTSDLLGFPAVMSDHIAHLAERQYDLPRERLLFNSSHTHGAPALHSPTHFMYGPRASAEPWRDIEEYTRDLERKIVIVIGAALKELQPARVSFGQSETDFGVDRRKETDRAVRAFVPNPDGRVDDAVPVLRLDSEEGRCLALVFGYAAHPTTAIDGPALYQFSGDYAGFAQEWLEREYPGAAALFVQGCGGDIMVSPRGTVELAGKYGGQLGAAVNKALNGSLRTVHGPLKAVLEKFPVEFATPPNRETLEKNLKHGDVYHRWHAQEMLKILDRDGQLAAKYPYTLKVWQFGQDLTLIAMAGEVVVDYDLRLKKELGADALWIAGYSNDVFAYIPSRRVLEEGGYEGGDAMIFYVQPGPFAPSIEETIVGKVHELVERARTR